MELHLGRAMSVQSTIVQVKQYAPGQCQDPHAHEVAHLSLVVAGGFEEAVQGSVTEAHAGRVGLRPQGLRHGVRFGPLGAVVLTCTAPTRCGGRPSIEAPHWSPVLPREHLRRLAPLLLEGGNDAQEATFDLLGLCLETGSPQKPDRWLRDVRRQLKEAPGATRLTDLAHRVGRHRVSIGRAFLAAYGEPPSVFRRRAMLDHALSLTASGTPPAWAAVEAGFVDQSHFIRACRDTYGVAPGRLLASAA